MCKLFRGLQEERISWCLQIVNVRLAAHLYSLLNFNETKVFLLVYHNLCTHGSCFSVKNVLWM